MAVPSYYGGGPSIVPFGQNGFTISYPSKDPATLGELREYQKTVQDQGWLSRMECDPVAGGLKLYVFAPDDLPAVLFGRPQRYGS